jgi:hypothetical protein
MDFNIPKIEGLEDMARLKAKEEIKKDEYRKVSSI